MNRFIPISLIFSISLFFSACKKSEEPVIQFETTAGIIKVKLYKDTPKHRDNIVKLVEEGYYDGLLFHKVVKDNFIQTGNPKSKDIGPNRTMDFEGPDYTIPAEINPAKHFHKKGALSAVRLPDTQNPAKASHGSQFCIIEGRKFKKEELDTIELDEYNRKLDLLWQKLVAKNRGKIDMISLRGTPKQLKALQDSLVKEANKEMKHEKVFFFSPEQRKAYTSVGGNPYMDREFTVFGEVTEGLDIVEKISKMETDAYSRPKQDVRIIKAKIID
jgi:peptidylprolyl isomerase